MPPSVPSSPLAGPPVLVNVCVNVGHSVTKLLVEVVDQFASGTPIVSESRTFKSHVCFPKAHNNDFAGLMFVEHSTTPSATGETEEIRGFLAAFLPTNDEHNVAHTKLSTEPLKEAFMAQFLLLLKKHAQDVLAQRAPGREIAAWRWIFVAPMHSYHLLANWYCRAAHGGGLLARGDTLTFRQEHVCACRFALQKKPSGPHVIQPTLLVADARNLFLSMALVKVEPGAPPEQWEHAGARVMPIGFDQIIGRFRADMDMLRSGMKETGPGTAAPYEMFQDIMEKVKYELNEDERQSPWITVSKFFLVFDSALTHSILSNRIRDFNDKKEMKAIPDHTETHFHFARTYFERLMRERLEPVAEAVCAYVREARPDMVVLTGGLFNWRILRDMLLSRLEERRLLDPAKVKVEDPAFASLRGAALLGSDAWPESVPPAGAALVFACGQSQWAPSAEHEHVLDIPRGAAEVRFEVQVCSSPDKASEDGWATHTVPLDGLHRDLPAARRKLTLNFFVRDDRFFALARLPGDERPPAPQLCQMLSTLRASEHVLLLKC